MPRANRHYLPGHIWHLTHRCHRKGRGTHAQAGRGVARVRCGLTQGESPRGSLSRPLKNVTDALRRAQGEPEKLCKDGEGNRSC